MKAKTFSPVFVSYILDTDLVYDPDRNLYTGTRSRLGRANLFQEIYKGDKITVGFAIRKSDVPGNPRQIFYLTDTVRSGNKIDSWKFTALDNSGTTVKIYNE
jgi:hypothetical protein